MSTTLKDLKDEAERRLTDNRPMDALKVYKLLLENEPLDFELRLDIGVLITSLEVLDFAAPIFRAVAEHNIKAGNPLGAMVAIKYMDALRDRSQHLQDLLVDTYAKDSPKLGRSVKPSPCDYSTKIRGVVDLDYEISPDELIKQSAHLAAYTENIRNYPTVVPPVPIFSTLDKNSFARLFKSLALCRHAVGDLIIKQGDPGDAIYFLASGEVSVVKTEMTAAKSQSHVRLARLGPGSLFGEMALVCNDPRAASVMCDTSVKVLKLACADIEKLAQQMTQVTGAMARFAREGMISNLLATSPLFKPFTEEDKANLLGRFTGHEVPQDTIFLEQGTVGTGLYIVLKGRAEVLKWDQGQYVKLADLGPGALTGEISLLYETKVSATVRTTTPCTLLFLARELFKPLVDAVPALREYFSQIARTRMHDTQFKLSQQKNSSSPLAGIFADVQELGEDDVVFL